MGVDAATTAHTERLNVLFGVTGGIAAYKAVAAIRRLVLEGHDVHVVATEAALRFVGKPTFEAISRNQVHSELYEGVAEVRHVALGQRADVIVIAPATANTIAKLASGAAEDLLGNSVLASTAPLVVAPAMHTEMWQHPATVANVATLRDRGAVIVGPDSGQLTGSDSGPGRLVDPDVLVDAVLGAAAPRDLTGRSIVVSAGGTREPIDPVRFVGNRSTGRQGIAIATAAARRGADVTLVLANGEVEAPRGMSVVRVSSTADLRKAMAEASSRHDIVIMAAAIADYRPSSVSESKIKKESQGDTLSIELVRNPDILAELSSGRREGQTIIGFAAETERDDEEMLRLGREKIKRKGCDFLVLNRVGWAEGFGVESNRITVLDPSGAIVGEASGSKASVADRILDLLI
ncbi:bifunctional phosphopantothenoylcysteine decarboxylase/phosphopantothenate--cysteine ligase CoaBC [Salinibacterium sp. dk2585]|uniref:bifunctional phosphopantothenoylcysteine decarboxylase/phosphopantothenate--cysteine ligase CoaBC n=1 Tax=unclassified Salinibacterium TaxID=2632331 RepID=UPI0011C24793|nr:MULTISPECIES: bifunctional phosphopantothenoylcysteine decarboxylase/phosphopantothenate--cysteine ligase CoaBC [unclassified Salinibacterium]QEE61267.1 bifunctional phosphopantothenoylcysteine decarboxylase/phosphopantothenate--cysteine ligase CoaBC [Salinibacterium sp. dk2585]TXK53943.1 bifunctional phosphopantothenoylcysteine decarboxylase/phosphopantothenate--cysteine ligase CoaBC [Salinibacterium sp. dk5596]